MTPSWRTTMTISTMALASTTCACAPTPGPRALPRGVTLVDASAPGDAAHPVEVRLALVGGALHLTPGPRDAPLVRGSIRAEDPTLLPHVAVSTRGVAVVQDFTPDEGSAPKIAWDLALGSTPMRLLVHVAGSEDQHVDLGGRSIVAARLYNEGGHLQVDWSASNSLSSAQLELWSIGYLEAHHLARSGAKRVEVKNVGLAEIDLGDRLDSDLRIDVPSSTGTLVFTLPAAATARAQIESSTAVRVETEGWDHLSQGEYVLGAPGASPRVTIIVHASSGEIRLRSSHGA